MEGTNLNGTMVINASDVTKGENHREISTSKKSVLDYGSRYGDFCFCIRSRPILRPIPRTHRPLFHGVILGSNAVALPEIGNFKRSGSFDFEGLPIEIQRQILRLLVAPFYLYDKETRKTEMPITIWASENRMPPSRRGNYLMEPDALRWAGFIDYPFLEWIRQASNVSRKFRGVLADSLWERSSLKITTGPLDTTLSDFMEDRPAACNGVRRLSFTLSGPNPFLLGPTDPTVASYRRFCSLASELRLETLDVVFSATEDVMMNNMEDMLAERGDYADIGGTRRLAVTKKFNLTIHCGPRGRRPLRLTNNVYVKPQKVKEFEEKYYPMIKALMMPTSLEKKNQAST